MKRLAALAFFASTLSAASIPVSGSGSWFCDLIGGSDYGYSFSIGGSGVGFHVNSQLGQCPFTAPASSLSGGTFTSFADGSGATIDNVSSRYFRYSLGNGGGTLDLYTITPVQTLLAHADLVSFVAVTWNDRTHGMTDGTITVNSTPEPATWAGMALGLVLLGWWRYRLLLR